MHSPVTSTRVAAKGAELAVKRILPNRMRIVTRNLQTEKRVFAWTSLSDCGRSASEEMQEQHHYPDYQHDVNQAAGNVKGQEPKQPKNNQDRSDYSKHVSNSFYL
jgi:hypothetical protein